jgi:hypothetical protein
VKFSQRAKTLPGDVASDVDWQEYLAEEAQEQVTDLVMPVPDQPVAEDEDREPLRLNLRALAGQLEDDFRNSRQMQKAAGILSNADREVMWAKAQQDRALMRREEESCFREFWRLTTILTNMQRRRKDWELGSQDSNEQDSSSRIPDSVADTESGIRVKDSGARIQDSVTDPESKIQHLNPGDGVDDSGFRIPISQSPESRIRPPESKPARRASGRKQAKPASPLHQPKNAGASGDVDENTSAKNEEMPSNPEKGVAESPEFVRR